MSSPIRKGAWILMTSLGWVIGFIFSMMIADIFGLIHLDLFALGSGMAAGVYFFQWLVLRKKLPVPLTWMWWGVFGIGVSFFVLSMARVLIARIGYEIKLDGIPALVFIFLATSIGGYLSGYFQYRKHFEETLPGSKKWVSATFLSWSISALVIANYFSFWPMLNEVSPQLTLVLSFIFLFSGGPIIGYFTWRAQKAFII